ncbi:MAG: HipA N-terminal domain-containing protein [Candidatus Aegiribacteria sp.]|nr:HipA N-terminal domain-containing protein [Candidatus Aegiribacteria sp.]
MLEPVRLAKVFMHGKCAGILEEWVANRKYRFVYIDGYEGPPISLTMPTAKATHEFSRFPAFFDGLLPEGEMLEGLLRQQKIDRYDSFAQLMAVGSELVGAVTVEEIL